MAKNECGKVVDFFASRASTTLKNPILDVLKQLVNDLDCMTVKKPSTTVSQATYGYMMFDTSAEDPEYKEQYPEFKDELGNFAAIQIDKNTAPNGINNHIFLPNGCHIMAPLSKFHDKRVAGEKKLEGFAAQYVTILSFYQFFQENRQAYISEIAPLLGERGEEAAGLMIDEFVAFFSPGFVEAYKTRA